MKYLSIIIFISLLTSCWVNTEEKVTATQKTTTEINNELDNLNTNIENNKNNEEEENEEKVVKIDATFNHPKQEVDMVVSYSVDKNNIINSIDVSATNWDLSKFNKEAQNFIWKSLSEISETTEIISWQSLTTDAFKKALKNNE